VVDKKLRQILHHHKNHQNERILLHKGELKRVADQILLQLRLHLKLKSNKDDERIRMYNLRHDKERLYLHLRK
jgi:hypothetical protein